ncbi:hypothetical protein [Streptomyces sp. NPDC086182]
MGAVPDMRPRFGMPAEDMRAGVQEGRADGPGDRNAELLGTIA